MIVLGRVVAPYGVAGWVKIHPFGDDPAAWREMPCWWLGTDAEGQDWQPFAVKGFRPHGGLWIAKLEGIDDRTAAEILAGRFVAAPREALPAAGKDEYYWGDLIGLAVENGAGESLGKVEALMESGAGQVLVVREGERERLLPFVGQVVMDVNVAGGRILVEWGADW